MPKTKPTTELDAPTQTAQPNKRSTTSCDNEEGKNHDELRAR